MSVSSAEYRELVSFFTQNSSAHNILSMGLVQANNSVALEDANASIDVTLFTDTFISDNTSVIFQSENYTNNSDENAPATYTSTSATVVPRISSDIPIWLIPSYSVIFFFAIVGNLLVISTLVQNRRMRTITNVFLLNLAISDILLGVLCMPVTLVGTLLRHFIFGEFLCKLIQFSQAASVAVSSWTLVAISCERYYAICHPLRSRTWQTINHAYRIIGFIWFGSIVCMTPIAIFSQLMPTSRQGLRKCREHWPKDTIVYERSYNIFLDLALLVLPLLILCVAYILITRTLYVSMRNERALIFGSSTTGGSSKVEGVATVTTALMPSSSSSFSLNLSFGDCQKRHRDGHIDNGGGEGSDGGIVNVRGVVSNATADMEMMYHQHSQQHKLKQQQSQQQPQPTAQQPNFYDNGKRKLMLGTATQTDGHRYLFGKRQHKQQQQQQNLNENKHSHAHNNNAQNKSMDAGGGGGSCITPTLHIPQQTCFELRPNLPHSVQKLWLHRQPHPPHRIIDRRKSSSSRSLHLTEAALRRSNETKNLESKRRVVKMLFVLVLEFFICWTPLYVINTVAMFIGPAIYEYIDYTSISFFQLLAYSSSCCNPITYCFMNANFRRAFLDTFKVLHLRGGRSFWHKRAKTGTNLPTTGNSIALGNSATIMSNDTALNTPRM